MRSAVIIAGGRSTRFGDADKAVAELAGTPMIRRVADRLVGVTDELVVNCRADQREAVSAALADYPNSVEIAVDDEPDRGPVAGMRTGLAATDGSYAVVVACDLPFLDPELVAMLFDRAVGHDAAVPRPDEYIEPTQAVYRREPAIATCDAALADGDPGVRDVLAALDVAVVTDVPDQETFRDVDTHAEFEMAAETLRQREEQGDDRRGE